MAILPKKAKEVDQLQIQQTGDCMPHEIAALVDEIGALLPAAEKAQKRIKMLQASLSPIPGEAHDVNGPRHRRSAPRSH